MFLLSVQTFLYRYIFKPIAFRFDPETVHDSITIVGNWMGKHKLARQIARAFWHFENTALEQTIAGIHFPNPVGLTAGFDKDGLLTDILPDVGFGFVEIGSVTGKPCEGNPKPRLWRLPKSEALIVYYGLKNEGCDSIHDRLVHKKFRIPMGVSVAKTNCQETANVQNGISDYVKAMKTFLDIADYITINISCPNAFGGEPFTKPELLEQLLCATDALNPQQPVFLKMPVDLSFEEIDKLVDVALLHKVHGFILSNLTKRRDRPEINSADLVPTEKGGISGRPVFDLSNNLIEHLYKRVGNRLILIGTGGIFSAEDAYEKILRGASLVQLATGMIFRGPQLIGQINHGLVRLLKRDGYKSIREAIVKGRKVGKVIRA
ncbi:quinone-dependent dihydroorotate dehydrogenase [Candidatus Uhrbacteria bacterium]|nr:quinone-dependent dihydroorotate dehydrogenase [Candidatus Uhrbacteria bacterium]